jgi:hypothetical protein
VQTDELMHTITSSLTMKNARTFEIEEESFAFPLMNEGNEGCKCGVLSATDEPFPETDVKDDSLDLRINSLYKITVNGIYTHPDHLKQFRRMLS